MSNVIQFEIARQIRALKKFAEKNQAFHKGHLYDHLFTEQKLPDEVVEEIIKAMVSNPILFVELYISLPHGVKVYQLQVPFRGCIRSFEGMGKRGAMIEALNWLLRSHGQLISIATSRR